MYRTALVTTDGSPLAAAAFAHVKEVLDPEGTVVVVEVIDDPGKILARTTSAGFDYAMGSVIGPDLVDEIIAAERAEATKHLDEARAALAGLEVETVVLQGDPGLEIVSEAERRHADIVLMATHGRSGLRRTVLGSVADHVLRHLDGVPVLLIHPKG